MERIKPFDIQKANTKCVRVYIEGYLLDILKDFCKVEEMSMSETVNSALDSYFLKLGLNKYYYK